VLVEHGVRAGRRRGRVLRPLARPQPVTDARPEDDGVDEEHRHDQQDEPRAWVRELFAGLAREAGAADPDGLSAQLVLLYDGSMVGAQLDRSAAPGTAAQAAAAALLQ